MHTRPASTYAEKKLSQTDLAALSGAHTVGFSKCQNFRAHIYNDINVDPAFAAQLKAICSATGPDPTDGNLGPFDERTPLQFDNAYYGNLVARHGLIHSDQELFNGGSLDNQVKKYSTDQATFFADFTAAMVKMGNISPLTGTAGQIRRNCRAVNSS